MFVPGLVLAALIAPACHARPSVLWTPSVACRHALELLADEAQLPLPVTQWPLPARAVSDALDALPASLPPVLEDARQRVRNELERTTRARAQVDVARHGERMPGFGEPSTPGPWTELRSATVQSNQVVAQFGGRIEAKPEVDRAGSQFRLDDSTLATEAAGIQWQAWSHRSWWSPAWQNALALSNNPPAYNGLGIQRASAAPSTSRWSRWMGPWNFDAFVAQAEDVTQPANPYMIGFHLSLRPLPWFELGVTKMAQWGGKGRPQTFKSFLNMLDGNHTNADTVSEQRRDPGNGLGGFEWRLRCPARTRCSVYGELIGEDEAGKMPSKYLGTYGVSYWSEDAQQRVFLEYTESTCGAPLHRRPERGCAYRNYAYPQGYDSGGRWAGASVGPDSVLATLGWVDLAHDRLLKLYDGHVGSRIGEFSPIDNDPQHAGHLVGVDVSQGIRVTGGTLRPHLSWLRTSTAAGPRVDLNAGLQWDTDLEDVHASSADPHSQSRAFDAVLLLAAAAALDHTMDVYAQEHGGNASARAFQHVGNAIPLLAFAGAGADWLENSDSHTGLDALKASIAAGASAEALKLAIDRGRPQAGRGPADFGDTPRADSSFPSLHATVAWAALTPYAEQNDAPWLYGVAALTNASRVLGRHHWLSDTVAGSLLGAWWGDHFTRCHRAATCQDGLWIGPGRLFFSRTFD